MSTIQQIYGDLFKPSSLVDDLDGARANRERIEQARQFEPPPVTRYYKMGSGRFGPAKLKKINQGRKLAQYSLVRGPRVPRSGKRGY